MPGKMVAKRTKKAKAKTYAKSMRLYRNMPRSFPKASNLLIKSQYCDFELTHLVPMEAVSGQAQERTFVFSRYDWSGIVQSVVGFDSAPLWTRIRRVFEEYAVKGFRLEYIPTNVVGS